MTIKVTIGVCARNCENAVEKIIDRISNQDFPHEKIEVLFVEEGSDDGTLSSILKYASTMDMVYKVLHHNWKGLGYSRNVILNNAHGDFIVWVDDGTIIPKDFVRKLVDFMEKHPNVGIARGLIGVYSGSNLVAALQNIYQLLDNRKYAGKHTPKLVATSGCIYRVKAARQVNGFDENIQGAAEDNDIAYRILLAGWKIRIVKVPFSIEYTEEIRSVWRKYLWYGYGAHFVLHKHRELRKILVKGTPLAGILEGILAYSIAYKFSNRKIALLLPMFISFERTAWCLGFIRAHLDSYGH